MAKRINDLIAAGSVQDTMQFETDLTGTTSNKVTASQIKSYSINNLETEVAITFTPVNYTPASNTINDHLQAIDTKLGEILATLEDVLEVS